jgi:hypothetical protein
MRPARKLARRDRLLLWFGVAGPPAAWTLHLLLGYGYEEAACSNRGGLDVVEPLIVALTVVLAAATLAAGAAGYVSWRATRRGDLDDPRGRVAFMGFSGVVASALFLAIIVFGGVQLVVLDPCLPG